MDLISFIDRQIANKEYMINPRPKPKQPQPTDQITPNNLK